MTNFFTATASCIDMGIPTPFLNSIFGIFMPVIVPKPAPSCSTHLIPPRNRSDRFDLPEEQRPQLRRLGLTYTRQLTSHEMRFSTVNTG